MGKIECKLPICIWTTLSICLLIYSIKWKPPNEISIDFRLERASLPTEDTQDPSSSEYSLYTWSGGNEYEYFDRLIVDRLQYQG